MGVPGFIATVILLILQFLGAMRLYGALSKFAYVESVILIVGLIVSVIALIGLAINSRWGWGLTLIVFSGSLGNFIWIYTQLGSSLTIAVSMLVTVFSMMIAFVAVDLWEPEQDWEPEQAEEKPRPARKKKKRR